MANSTTIMERRTFNGSSEQNGTSTNDIIGNKIRDGAPKKLVTTSQTSVSTAQTTTTTTSTSTESGSGSDGGGCGGTAAVKSRGRRGLQEEYVSTRFMVPASNKHSKNNKQKNRINKNVHNTERRSISPRPPSRYMSVKKIPSNEVTSKRTKKDVLVPVQQPKRQQQPRQRAVSPFVATEKTNGPKKSMKKKMKKKKVDGSTPNGTLKFSEGSWKPVQPDDDSPVCSSSSKSTDEVNPSTSIPPVVQIGDVRSEKAAGFHPVPAVTSAVAPAKPSPSQNLQKQTQTQQGKDCKHPLLPLTSIRMMSANDLAKRASDISTLAFDCAEEARDGERKDNNKDLVVVSTDEKNQEVNKTGDVSCQHKSERSKKNVVRLSLSSWSEHSPPMPPFWNGDYMKVSSSLQPNNKKAGGQGEREDDKRRPMSLVVLDPTNLENEIVSHGQHTATTTLPRISDITIPVDFLLLPHLNHGEQFAFPDILPRYGDNNKHHVRNNDNKRNMNNVDDLFPSIDMEIPKKREPAPPPQTVTTTGGAVSRSNVMPAYGPVSTGVVLATPYATAPSPYYTFPTSYGMTHGAAAVVAAAHPYPHYVNYELNPPHVFPPTTTATTATATTAMQYQRQQPSPVSPPPQPPTPPAPAPAPAPSQIQTQTQAQQVLTQQVKRDSTWEFPDLL